jgi:hypothetical protein
MVRVGRKCLQFLRLARLHYSRHAYPFECVIRCRAGVTSLGFFARRLASASASCRRPSATLTVSIATFTHSALWAMK